VLRLTFPTEVLLLGLAVCLMAPPAMARDYADRDRSWRDERGHRDYSGDYRTGYRDGLDGVVSDLRHRRQGRVLSADTVEENGRSVHRIRILNDDGRVRRLQFDGDTGRPLPRSRYGDREGRRGDGGDYRSYRYRDRHR